MTSDASGLNCSKFISQCSENVAKSQYTTDTFEIRKTTNMSSYESLKYKFVLHKDIETNYIK